MNSPKPVAPQSQTTSDGVLNNPKSMLAGVLGNSIVAAYKKAVLAYKEGNYDEKEFETLLQDVKKRKQRTAKF